MKKFCLVSLLLLLLVPIVTGFSQESSSDRQPESVPFEQLELDLAAKRKEAADLLYGNYYQSEVLSQDISFIVPSGNELVTLIERGILAGGDSVPGAYWLIQVENISEQFLPAHSVLSHLMIQEATLASIKPAAMRISHIDSQLMYEQPLEALDPTVRFAPGTIQHFRILVPLENPFAHYQLVQQTGQDTLISEIFQASPGGREIMLIVEQPDLNFEELDISEQMETLLKEIAELDAELLTAKASYYNDLSIDSSKLQFEELDLALSEASAEAIRLVQHGMSLSEENSLEAFWIFKTVNTSPDFQYATKELWPLTAHQGMTETSDHLVPYSVQQVEATSAGVFYSLENNLEQALVEPGWEGYFKVSIPFTNPIFDHYLLYDAKNNPTGQRLDVYNDGIFE